MSRALRGVAGLLLRNARQLSSPAVFVDADTKARGQG